MVSLCLYGISCINGVLDCFHTSDSTGGKIFAFHNGCIQFERPVSGTRRPFSCIEQGIAFKIVNHSHHRLRALATGGQNTVADHQGRIQSGVVLNRPFRIVLKVTHIPGASMYDNHIFALLCKSRECDTGAYKTK